MADNWIYTIRSSTLQKRLFADLDKQVFTDLTIKVGSDGNQHVFKAHRLVLASENSELERMVLRSPSGEIKIPDVHPKAFENVIRYCYGESMFFKDIASIRGTYLAAEKFKAKKLQQIIEENLFDLMKSHSLVEILTLSTELNLTRVKERCLDAISSQLMKVLKTEEFISAPLQVIEKILCLCSDREQKCKSFAMRRIHMWRKQHGCSDITLLHLLSMIYYENVPPEDLLFLYKENYMVSNELSFPAGSEILSSKEDCPPLKNIYLERTNTLPLEATEVKSSQIEPKPLFKKEKMVTDEVQETGSKDEKEIIVERAEDLKPESVKNSDAGYDSDDDCKVIGEDVIQECMADISNEIQKSIDFMCKETVATLIKEAERLIKDSAAEMQYAVDDLEDSFTNSNAAQVKSE